MRGENREHNVLFFNLLFNCLCHLDETFFDASRGLGRSLQEEQIVGVSELFSSFEFDLSLGNKVAFVTDQQFVNVLASVTVDLQQPLLDVVECFRICNIINDNNTVSTAVVAASNGSIKQVGIRFSRYNNGSPLTKIKISLVVLLIQK